MKLLEGKTAIVTGGSRGIGMAIVKKFAEQGAKVAFTYHASAEKAMALENEIAANGGIARGFKSDASLFDECKKLTDDVMAAYGRIDVLINNAGVTRDNLLLRMSPEQFDEVMKNNIYSAYNMCKHVAVVMLKQKSGSIVNMSSIVGNEGQAGQSNYAASKAALIGFSKALCDELGSRNIRVNAIAPGFIETDMTDKLPAELKENYFARIPLKRFGKAEEVANACLFLASDMSSYISGQTINVCGGLQRK